MNPFRLIYRCRNFTYVDDLFEHHAEIRKERDRMRRWTTPPRG